MALPLFYLLLSGHGFGALTALVIGRGAIGRGLTAFGAIAGSAGAMTLGGYVLIAGQPFTFTAPQILPLSGLALRVDGLGAFFLVSVGLIGMALGAPGTSMAQQHLRKILAYLDMPTLGQPEAFYPRWGIHP